MLFPVHIATRGRLDGEYGIATRGLLICPDIVPRYPSDSAVSDDDLVASISDADLLRVMVSEHPSSVFEGFMVSEHDFSAQLDLHGMDFEAVTVDLDMGARIEVIEGEAMVGVSEQSDPSGAVSEDQHVASVSEEDVQGGIDEEDELVAPVEDEPPHC